MSIHNFDYHQEPGLSAPEPGANTDVHLSDPHSTDAATLNTLVQEKSEPPSGKQLPAEQTERLEMPKGITRLIANTLVVQKTWDRPVLLLPKDNHRKELHITVISTTTTDVVQIADEENAGQLGVGNVYLIPAGPNTVTIKHTGPVWVFAPNIAGPSVTVSAVAVREP